MPKRCSKCGEIKELFEFNHQAKSEDGHQYYCRMCANGVNTVYHRANGQLPMSENKTCSSYLGVAVAERLIKHLFNEVVRMPYGNPGFDFICAKGKKIDVKSACITLANKKYPRWIFGIHKNTIADYFLLLAFNNREDLAPQYQWLIPGQVLNHLKGTTYISPKTTQKWVEWMQPIEPALTCCNTLK